MTTKTSQYITERTPRTNLPSTTPEYITTPGLCTVTNGMTNKEVKIKNM